MKKILILLSITFILMGLKDGKITIKGDLGAGHNFDAYLSVTAADFSSKNIAVSKADNGKFTFELSPPDVPTIAYISYNGSGHRIILENDNITSVYSRTTGYNITGGKYNNLIYGWEKFETVIQINTEMYNLSLSFDIKSMTPQETDNYKAKSMSLRSRLVKIQREYLYSLYSHEDPYVRLFAVIESNSISDKEMAVLSTIKDNLPSNPDLLKLLKRRADSDKRLIINRKLIIGGDFNDINAVTFSNSEVNLSKTIKQNKYTLLEFWASWCKPCREEMSKLPDIYLKYRAKGFEIFSFSIDSTEDAWRKAAITMNIPWINAYSSLSGVGQVKEMYAIESIPKNFLIDNDGKIVAVNIKAEQLAVFLGKALN